MNSEAENSGEFPSKSPAVKSDNISKIADKNSAVENISKNNTLNSPKKSAVNNSTKKKKENISHLKLFEYDSEIRREYAVICGVDEAGRGPLAGDVYAAACVLSPETVIKGLNDSKKLTETQRDELFDEICEKAISYSIAVGTVTEIEEINILQATLLAMRRAVAGLKIMPNLALVDGNRLPKLEIPTQTIIKGDGISASIAAASVLAKVARDRYMLEISKRYPQYLFEQHKGYGTKLHYEKLKEHGVSPIHRKTFLKNL